MNEVVVQIPSTLEQIEIVVLKATLIHLAGNKKSAAQKLGISRSALYAKLKRYGLQFFEGSPDPQPGEAPRTGEGAL